MKKCHSEVGASPIAFDPLLNERAVSKPADMTYFRESFPHGSIFNKQTKIDENKRPSWIQEKTRMLNEFSDFGDALNRFKKPRSGFHRSIDICNFDGFYSLLQPAYYEGH
jgi:hypothetical protein